VTQALAARPRLPHIQAMRHSLFRSALGAVLLCLFAFPVAADLEGQPEIIDGDTMSIAGITFDLYGIDAPENDQTCTNDGGSYPCGFQAANVLGYMTAYQWVQCRDQGTGPDGRAKMACVLGGRYDIGERMVRQGWALADRSLRIPTYLAAEQAARAERAGLWAGGFDAPWEWRNLPR
jgi:endonuclease YncB( thermonuclease family)